MKRKPKIGLLALYLKLYDDTRIEWRKDFGPFRGLIAGGFAERGVDVVESDICRVSEEFDAAIKRFRDEDVDCLVTLHLAYSPSLESIDAVSGSGLPILILDTTMDACFGPETGPDRIMYNHGIHGVMDFASMLRRRGVHFEIVAGHVTESRVMDRAADMVRAAYAARCLRSARTLRIGPSFEGMGDFAVEDSIMRSALGITVDQEPVSALAEFARAVSGDEVRREIERDRTEFDCSVAEDTHARSVRAGLALRKMLVTGGYSAFSMNFLEFDGADESAPTVPFLEASRAMARGLGYAGEGDVLTAALVGALICGFDKATFTEIFCPNWRGGNIFLSHMGEINPTTAGDRPVLAEMDFPYTGAPNPAALACSPAPGPAVFVNLVPGPANRFGIVAAPVNVLPDTGCEAMKKVIRGWMKPAMGVEEFLEKYSRRGGTHHSALALGDRLEAVTAFARFAGLKCDVLRGEES